MTKPTTIAKKKAKFLGKRIIKNIRISNNSFSVIRNSSSIIRADYGQLYMNGGFEALGTTRKKYRKKTIATSNKHNSTCRRAFNAAELDVDLHLKPNTVPEYPLRHLHKTNKIDRKAVWKLACNLAKGKYPTGKEVETAQIEFSSTSENQNESNNINSKKPVKAPSHETNNNSTNKPVTRKKMTAKIALKKLESWDNKTAFRNVISILSGETQDSKACLSIIRNLTDKEIKELVENLYDLPLAPLPPE